MVIVIPLISNKCKLNVLQTDNEYIANFIRFNRKHVDQYYLIRKRQEEHPRNISRPIHLTNMISPYLELAPRPKKPDMNDLLY